MQLGNDKVGTINYKLIDSDGNQLDESSDGSFSYLHGANNIIPGLEKALEGRKSGDSVSVDVKAEDAYGDHNEDLVQRVPRDIFPEDIDISIGMQFHAQSSEGHPMIVTINTIEEEEIVVDGNHPMAGMALHFDVDIIDVRDATSEEIDHGHVHGEDGHHHDH